MNDLASSSLLRPGSNCCAIARADRAAVLIDGAAYFDAFVRAAERARRSIMILAWDFDSRTALDFDADGRPRTLLGDFLNGLARRRPRLKVRILDWDYPMIFAKDREMAPIYGFTWKPHRRVHFHYDDTHPIGGSHHQKIVVIDDRIAFVGGIDVTLKRWDTPEHRADDPRRRDPAGAPYPPFHDLMVAVDGEAASVLARIARKRWLVATGETLGPVSGAGEPWPPDLPADFTHVDIGIATTSPPVNGHDGAREVEQLYLDMIAAARRTIYIENQFFTAQRVGEALAARLAEPDGPEIVVATRLLSHGWLEEATMHVLRTGLIRRLRAADHAGRFSVWYPHTEGLADGTCIDLHSKLMIVDDRWLRIGSSNLSNRSMGVDTECDLLLESPDERASQTIRALRDRLLAEHLDAAPEAVAAQIEARGSLRGAIEALAGGPRTLKPLADVPEWSDTVLSTVSLADPERPVTIDTLVGQFVPPEEAKAGAPLWKKALGVGVVLLALALAWRYTPLADLITTERIAELAQRFGSRWWAPLAIVLAYTPASVVMFPRPLITLAAVLAFGPWVGFGYAIIGVMLAALATYAAGRFVRRDTVRRIAGEKLNRVSRALRRRGLLAVTAIRFVPLAPFAVEGLIAGAIRIRLWHYMLGTAIGMAPGMTTTTIIGGQINTSLTQGADIDWRLIAAAIVVLVVATLAVRRWLLRLAASDART